MKLFNLLVVVRYVRCKAIRPFYKRCPQLTELRINGRARLFFHVHGFSYRIGGGRHIWEPAEIREIVELVRAGGLRVIAAEIDGESIPGTGAFKRG